MANLVLTDRSSFTIVLTGFLALAIAMGVGRFAFTPMLPLMQSDGSLSISSAGILASLHFVGYWLGALFAARLPFPPRQTFSLSILAIAFATIGMGLTQCYWLWSGYRLICGICSAFILVIVSEFAIKRLAQTNRAKRQGVIFAGVGAGIALVGLAVLALMFERAGSALSWQIIGGGALVAASIVLIFGGNIFDEVVSAARETAPQTPLHWELLTAYGTVGAGYIIPATYLPSIARETIQNPLMFGWIWPIFGLATFFSTLLSVHLFAAFTNRQIWAVSQAIMAASVALSALYPHVATVLIAGMCVGGTFMIITMAGMREAHRIVSGGDVRRHIAALTAAFATGQIIGPVAAGSIHAATGSFGPVLITTSLCLGLSLIGLSDWRVEQEIPR